MKFEFTGYDETGKPTHVATDDGFMQSSRPFNEEEDGWMLDQLRMIDFPAIELGRDMEGLMNEVNYLRRENFRMKKALKY